MVLILAKLVRFFPERVHFFPEIARFFPKISQFQNSIVISRLCRQSHGKVKSKSKKLTQRPARLDVFQILYFRAPPFFLGRAAQLRELFVRFCGPKLCPCLLSLLIHDPKVKRYWVTHYLLARLCCQSNLAYCLNFSAKNVNNGRANHVKV